MDLPATSKMMALCATLKIIYMLAILQMMVLRVLPANFQMIALSQSATFEMMAFPPLENDGFTYLLITSGIGLGYDTCNLGNDESFTYIFRNTR